MRSCYQNDTLAPSWTFRGLLPWPVNRPNWLLLCVVFGLEKVTRFRTFEAEARPNFKVYLFADIEILNQRCVFLHRPWRTKKRKSASCVAIGQVGGKDKGCRVQIRNAKRISPVPGWIQQREYAIDHYRREAAPGIVARAEKVLPAIYHQRRAAYISMDCRCSPIAHNRIQRRMHMAQPLFPFSDWQLVHIAEPQVVGRILACDGFVQAPVVRRLY